tara:strand:+ start:761 stop:940 length:180 start_codon:yes stop_codon:yes gene_type:complete
MPELLPIVVNETKIICSQDDWIRMDRQEAYLKECNDRKNNLIYTPLQRKIINSIVLQDE